MIKQLVSYRSPYRMTDEYDWTCDEDPTIIGRFCLYERSESVGFVCNFRILNDDQWGKGYGTQMMRECIQEGRARDMLFLSLDVSNSNTYAVRLYEKLGFVLHDKNGWGSLAVKALRRMPAYYVAEVWGNPMFNGYPLTSEECAMVAERWRR